MNDLITACHIINSGGTYVFTLELVFEGVIGEALCDDNIAGYCPPFLVQSDSRTSVASWLLTTAIDSALRTAFILGGKGDLGLFLNSYPLYIASVLHVVYVFSWYR